MRGVKTKLLALAGAMVATITACNDLGIIPTVSYPDCDDVKDAVWLKLRQLDFGFFCRSCTKDLDCFTDQVCSKEGGEGVCYNPDQADDPCNPGLSSEQAEAYMKEHRIRLLAPLYECRMDELVKNVCPDDVKRRAAAKFLDMMTNNECNPCDELSWRFCLCEFDPGKYYAENNMLKCMVADGGRKANPLWKGYVQTQEIDCQASLNDFSCSAYYPEEN